MTVGDLSDPEAVRKAIDEFDRIGREAFLEKYGFGGALEYVVVENGREYDSKAIVGAAHRHQFGEPLSNTDFSGGARSTVPKLRSLGFTVRAMSEHLRAFIFQSNPKYFDIARAVRSLGEMNWTVAQSKNQIHAGDRVYIWQSGPGGGVIAEGRILTDPAMLSDQEGEEFILDSEKFAGEQLRVRLSIDKVLDEPLERTSLQSHPVLKDLGIIHFANATNYSITAEQDGALQALIAGDEPPASAPPSASPLDALADELLVPPEWLSEVSALLRDKRQIIFQGPPGTGKTYVARRLARYFEEQGGGAEIVQFHPSYAYEDFVEGYRPRLLNGQPGFELVEGPLKRLAARAEADREQIYVLVIDELNRGNVAKVFGELYYLLEYRDDRIRLQYASDLGSGEDARFGLPPNLWIIATMNTADRSIALIDAALRRRFYFVDYYPDEPPVDNLLARWIDRHGLDQFGWLPLVLQEANRRLDDRDAAVGPSYFLLEDPTALTDEQVHRVWRHAVLPYLQELLIGEPERLREFELSKLRRDVAAESEPLLDTMEPPPPTQTT